MLLRKLSLFLLCSIGCLAVSAEVPYTFTPGQAANAEEVNANFSALVTQIEQLQAQIAAMNPFGETPTVQSLAGTYDFFELAVDVDQNGVGSYAIGGESTKGTAILDANGTGTVTSSGSSRQLSFFTQSKTVGSVQDGGSIPVDSTSVQLNDYPDSDSGSFTWSLSGSVVTITDDSVINLSIVGGRMLIASEINVEGRQSILIVVRR